MKIINNYRDINPGPLQLSRLYLTSRPMARLHRKKIRNISVSQPDDIKLIDQELASDYISIDCAGWYLENNQRACTAIETSNISHLQKPDAIIETNYYQHRPDYLENLPVLCYYSGKFRYSTLQDFSNFFNIWGPGHGKYIVGLDPTKVKFNYLKYSLTDKLSSEILWPHEMKILFDSNFDLIFTITSI